MKPIQQDIFVLSKRLQRARAPGERWKLEFRSGCSNRKTNAHGMLLGGRDVLRWSRCGSSCAPVLEEQLLRIGQEALINAGRHARASKIRVQLTYEEDHVELRVSDDGIGFDA